MPSENVPSHSAYDNFGTRSLSEYPLVWRLLKNVQMQGARNPEEWGVFVQYAAMTKDKCNTADGRFPTAS